MSQSTTIYEIDLNGRQYGMLEKMLCSARAEQLAANQLIDGDGLFLIWWMPYTRLWRTDGVPSKLCWRNLTGSWNC